MISARLIRYHFGLRATLGILKLNVAHSPIYTLELPWRENKADISCIPQGTYRVIPHNSEAHPKTYEITNVLNREAILIHVGNYPANFRGCVGVGLGVSPTTPMISNSEKAMDLLRNEIIDKEFTLTIENL